jgi:nucleotide-binding universal stress UspA family protein
MAIKRILVPVDFSAPSLRALDYAVRFAKPIRAELTLCFVVEPLVFPLPEYGATTTAVVQMSEMVRRGGRSQLARLERRYRGRGLRLRTELLTGAASQAIVSLAARRKSDVIIMATHGRTGLSHLFLGSVAERVVRTAPCPVLTLRFPERQAARRAPATRPASRARRGRGRRSPGAARKTARAPSTRKGGGHV